jgi:hypothetical protein
MDLWRLLWQVIGNTPLPPAESGASYAETLIALAPTAYWRLGESSGNAIDSSGNSHTLTTGGTPTYSAAGWPGDGDTAITFDADWFTATDAAWMDVGTADFTVAWCMKHAPGWPATIERILGHDGQGYTGEWTVYLRASIDDTIRLTLDGGTNYNFTTSANLLDDGAWHHCVLSIDRSANGVLYVDGGVQATVDVSASVAVDLTNARALWLGARSAAASEPYVGSLDEVAFWNGTALTAPQVAALYAARDGSGAPPPPPSSDYATAVLALSPVAYFSMNEDGTTLTDASSNANHGTYTGSPGTTTGPIADSVGRTFDGATQWASAPHHAAYNFALGDYSIVAWVYVGVTWPAAESWLIGHGGNGEGSSWEVYLRTLDNRLRSRVGGVNGDSSGATDISTAAWHMVAVCVDRSGLASWYVDNVANGTTDVSSASAEDVSMTTSLYIARRGAGGYLAGSVAQVAAFASCLTAGDIATLYAAAGY